MQNFGPIFENSEIYQKEKEMQKSLGKEDKIFHNELEEFWVVFDRIINESLFGISKFSPDIHREIIRVFPKSLK